MSLNIKEKTGDRNKANIPNAIIIQFFLGLYLIWETSSKLNIYNYFNL